MLRLKELRKKRNATQQEVADMLNITRAAYSNIENGKRDPDTETIVRLAQFFNVSTDYLLGLTDNPAPIPQLQISQQDRTILDEIKSLSPERQKALEIALRILKSEEEEKSALENA